MQTYTKLTLFELILFAFLFLLHETEDRENLLQLDIYRIVYLKYQ